MSGAGAVPEYQPFSSTQIVVIREAIRQNQPAVCPECSVALHWGPPAGGGTVGFYWLVHCIRCHRGLTVTDFRG